ncbi:hypothetical protein Btru_055751, partial [Bulinus truncatus]
MELYPYGTNVGDKVLLQEFGAHSPMILFSSGLPFGSKVQKFAHVSMNGAITFGDPRYALSPNVKNAIAQSQNLFAPFQSEIDPYYTESRVFFHLYEQTKLKGTNFDSPKQNNIFSKASDEVRQMFPSGTDSFNASTVLVVTWSKVKPYSWYSSQCKSSGYSVTANPACGNQTEVNTFQATIASNGTTTYAITMYQTGGMKWEYVPNRIIFVGYLTDNKLKDYKLTYSRLTVSLDRDLGTAGRVGTYIDLVGTADNSAQKCINFYNGNLQLSNSVKFQDDIKALPSCPCSLERLDFRWSLVEKRSDDNTHCYAILPSLLPTNSVNKLCCYKITRASSRNWEDEQKANRLSFYVSGTLDSGHILTESPSPESRRRLLEKDITPKTWCCQESDLCDLFNNVRPELPCSLAPPFVSASSFGDPHIITLDNNQYTLNNWGESILLSVPEKNFMMQARTDRVEISNGTFSNATVFVAFAVNENNNSLLQVELSLKKTSMNILADKIDFTNDFYGSTSFQKILTNFVIYREDGGNKTKLVATFRTGITLRIFVGVKSLELNVQADISLRRKTKGLMGDFDGNPDNDFVLPNGTVLTQNQRDTERKIFYNFGKYWEVNDNNTVFTYGIKESAATYSHPDFIPTFIEEASNESVAAAIAKCGSGNDACIFDYLATKNEDFARNTNNTNLETRATIQSLSNNLPVLSLNQSLNNASQWEVIADQINYFRVLATDADRDNITYRVQSNYTGLNISADGLITFIPSARDSVVIQVIAVDSKDGPSNTVTIPTAACTNCSGHGDCNKNKVLQFSESSIVYACTCYPAYTGDFCSENFNACAASPCATGQNCTDLTPEQQGMNQTGYVCGPCPVGFEEVQGRCVDINECRDNVTCPQLCENSVGSYTCGCRIGYRLNQTNSSICDDINECEEKTDTCSQICVNSPGSYTCSCLGGYYLDNAACVKNITNRELCTAKNCSDLCFVDNGEARCGCSVGYSLDTDNRTCKNIDECSLAKKPCSQVCTDTPGKFFCSCFAGFKLAADRISCTECEKSFYGANCEKTCQCSGRGSCDSVRGCVCERGWVGENCNTDIDECQLQQDNCTTGEICINGLGSFACVCPIGERRNASGQCEDINECSDPTLNSCNLLIEDCVNNKGSYACNCKSGYKRNITGGCDNIDECSTGDHKCTQICVDVPGKYNCDCKYGFKLDDDRFTCIFVKDVCKDFEKLNCSYQCTVDLKQNTSYCFCPDGYRLIDREKCQDINECGASSTNLCSYKSGCINQEPGYRCTCPAGQRLDNDGRTCLNCSTTTWGINCSTSCSCSTGATRCDNVKGCICKPGYTGVYCDVDVNQCTNGELTCNDRQQCVNRPGPDSCVCKSGYVQTNGFCEDINECSRPALNNCSQLCTNSIGKYSCGCYEGFTYNATTNSCDDINECTLNIHKCTSVCVNTLGNYRCSCKPGYVLNKDGFTCDVSSVCANSSVCQYQCVNNGGVDTCFCPRGQALNTDNKTCRDIDLCQGSPCSDLCNETPDSTSIICSCLPGKLLAANGITCQACSSDTWGVNCANNCTCSPSTTFSCNPVTGSCQCLPGWNGTDCSVDINECTLNQTICSSVNNTECLNTNGSYSCVCQLGYGKTSGSDVCQGCSDFFYGKDCSQQCNCNSFHSTCDKTNGTCHCIKGWTGPTCDDDIDECLDTASCNSTKNELCVDTEGSFYCSCQLGYYRPNSSSECTVCPPFYYGEFCSQSCACNSNNANSCNNVNGTCSCKSQWRGTDCTTDVDECQENTYNCPNNSHCTNVNGGYTCDCNSGYFKKTTSNTCQTCACNMSNTVSCNPISGSCLCKTNWQGPTCDDDIDECSNTNLYNCPSYSTCNNTLGGYNCLCLSGFNKNISTNKCDDIDECKDNTSTCPSNSNCINTVGGYNCICISGYFKNLTSNTCKECACNKSNYNSCDSSSGSCLCQPAWQGPTCNDDVNECSNNSQHSCPSNSACNNTMGGYDCLCLSGFYKNISTNKCDACACNMSNTNSCDATSGSCLCQPGWNGSTCSNDVDECSNSSLHNCPSNSTCNNTMGGYECLCLSGFYKNISTNKCDACACNMSNTNSCDATSGSCLCQPGWNGSTCSNDVDECSSIFYNCPSNSTCNNTLGGYNCLCLSGFNKNVSTNKCDDIDECKDNTSTCPSNSNCINTVGGYNCICISGYFKNLTSNTCKECACNKSNYNSCDSSSGSCLCQPAWQGPTCNDDVNECSNNSQHSCPSNSACNNTMGGYDCLCLSGFYKNISTNKCDECVADHYGYNCNNVCSCNTSNSVCNKTDGACKCNSGWTGAACSDDINECNIVGSICNTSKLETCYNIPGSYVCDCIDGYWREDDTSVCTKVTEKQFEITLTYNASGYNLTDVNQYNTLKDKTYTFLKDFFNGKVNKLRKIEVINLRYGSLIVDFKLYYDENQDPVATSLALKALLDSKNLTFGTQNVTVQSIKTSGINLTSTSTLCEIRDVVQKCADNEMCTENGTASVC